MVRHFILYIFRITFKFKFQKIRFQMTRDLREALRIPAGSRWNIGMKSASFAFVVKCSIAKRETFLQILFLWSQMDVISLHVMF
jgi:hypothetical protein